MANPVAALAKEIARNVAWIGFRGLTHAHVFGILVPFYERVMRQVDADGSLGPVRPASRGDFTILALSGEHYRKDPQMLAGVPGVRVLSLAQRWQSRLMYQFFDPGFIYVDYMKPPAGSRLAAQKERLRSFFRGFLPRLYARLSIDCVISPLVRYHTDADWGAVSQEIGVPYVVLQRENMVLSRFLREHVRERELLISPFEGAHVIVHNEPMRQVYIEAGIAEPSRISVLGCPRMDAFVKRAAAAARVQSSRKQVLFFPFYIGLTFPEQVRPFFDATHVALVRFARKNPDVELRIKPKPKFEALWRSIFDRGLAEAGVQIENVPNVVVDSGGDAQDLILEARVVSGLQTTTLLEAALAGRPVVIPYFKEMDDPEIDSRVMFREDFSAFDVARDPVEYVRMLESGLDMPLVSPDRHRHARDVFARYVSDPEGKATVRYIDTLKAEVAASRAGLPVSPAVAH